jgi:16S rRNA C967 or C1407 C5-methylase (RsmB/RsmF family)/NOL1/NOP2/fmu family ribosome biogenesis protein
MFPEGFKQRIVNQKYIDAEALFKALEEPSPISIRINRSKWDIRPSDAESVPWCNTGFYLDRKPSFTLDPLFHSGCYYPQEASGMFLEQAIKQTAGSTEKIRVLDLCGAPGGKSTHLSEMIGPDSLLVANEVIRGRAAILSETLTKWGAGNSLVTQNDPSLFGKMSGYFDVIVVDAPCSGEGMFRNSVAINEWSTENAAHCSDRQKRILKDVWPALKERGILIYSTCTFNPGENEENIKWLIEKKEAECVALNVTDFAGITEIDHQGIFGYGFYPDKVRGEGFFISVISKTGKQDNCNIGNHRKPQFMPSKTDLEVAGGWVHFPKERLIKWGDQIIAIPGAMTDYLHLFNKLNIIKPGTKISVVKKNNYLPSHELALSSHLKKDIFPGKELNLSQAIAFLRRDNFSITDIPKGWNIITYRGINLGFINNIGARFNNYFPVEWRIRMSKPENDNKNIISWD